MQKFLIYVALTEIIKFTKPIMKYVNKQNFIISNMPLIDFKKKKQNLYIFEKIDLTL